MMGFQKKKKKQLSEYPTSELFRIIDALQKNIKIAEKNFTIIT